MLKTFGKNFHPEFSGYCFETKGGVYISFIESKDKGKGNFTKLIKEFKKKYEFIKVPSPFPLMESICLKKGFVKTVEYDNEEHCKVAVLVWVM